MRRKPYVGLSNFYYDEAYIYPDFQAVIGIQGDLNDIMQDYLEQLNRNYVLGEIETYRYFEAQRVPLKDGVYDVKIILSNLEAIELLGYQDMSLDERIEAWYLMLPNDPVRIKVLDLQNAYIDLIATVLYPWQGEPEAPKFNVCYMDLYDQNDRLQIGVDFEIQNNRLYLLNEAHSTLSNYTKVLNATNVAVDYDTPSRFLGLNFNLPQYPDLSKDVFNDILQKLCKAALGGPTLRHMKQGLSSITNEPGSANIHDSLNAPPGRQGYWTTWDLSPFDFIVEIPAEFSVSDTLTDVVKRFLDVVKLADTAYQIVLNSIYEETYARHIKAVDYYVLIHIMLDFSDRDEIYPFRSIYEQTNVEEYRLNDNFSTEITHGAGQYEDCQTIITTYNAAGDVVSVETVDY